MVGSTRFVLAFVVFVCSMFVVTSDEVSRCPSGTHESWFHGRCLYINDINDIQGKEATWRTDRDGAQFTACHRIEFRGYDWKLPSFQLIGKHERLFEILQERACGNNCSTDDIARVHMKEWYFWIRLARKWKPDANEKPTDDGQSMKNASKWRWDKEIDSPSLTDDLAYGTPGYPPWAANEPNEEFHLKNTKVGEACVMSRIKEDGKYPWWFEWVVAPCNLDLATGETADNLRKAMMTNGILICEGIPNALPRSVVGTSTIPCMKATATSGNATDGPPATTPPSRPMYFNPVCGVFIALFVASLGFGITCSVCFFIQRRDIQKLEASAEKNKYVSTTSSDIPSMSTLVRIDSRPYTEDDHSRRMRLLALRAGKKKKRKTKKTKDQSEMS